MSASSSSAKLHVQNPFGVMDVPDFESPDVKAFAADNSLAGASDDANAVPWPSEHTQENELEGIWRSRWNGGADPNLSGDSPDRWKDGIGELRMLEDCLFFRFDWNGGMGRGLIQARRENGGRFVGKYLNLTNPSIVRPWVGLVVDVSRIDGRWTSGRLDLRR